MDSGNRASMSWDERQARKDRLLDRARYGEITGEEADAEAIRLGFGSLSRRPGPEEYRPESETHWTLPMAVAWIAYLDLDEVREWSARFREQCSHWRWQRWRIGFDGPIHEGWLLEPRPKPTLGLLTIGATYDRATEGKPLAMSIGQAREALWVALREHFFSATGVDTETGRRVEIPALEWHELVALEAKDEVDEVRRGLLGGAGYRDILIPSAALRGLWRKPVDNVNRLPPTMKPDGDGFMPLGCAAQWIATEGGSRDFDPADQTVWKDAYDKLLGAIASEKVRIIGSKDGNREPVPGYIFAGIVVDYPFTEPSFELIFSESIYLRCYSYIDEDHWRRGFDDALVSRHKKHWIQLQVEKGDVRRLWAFELKNRGTGAPGRPSKSMHLILDEFERRVSGAELARSLREEADGLIAWLKAAHPHSDRPSLKTVENRIRSRFREVAGTPK